MMMSKLLSAWPPLSQSTFAKKVLQNQMLVTPSQEIIALWSSEADDKPEQSLLDTSRWINKQLATQMSAATSEAAYTEKLLEDYDTFVWDFNSPFHWRIQPQDIHALYNDCLSNSRRHCEVAVGTGLFLKDLDNENTVLRELTLVDLNSNSLASCHKRLSGAEYYSNNVKIEQVLHDVLSKDSCPLELNSYDSVAANFLLHCLHEHGDRDATLRIAIENMSRLLKPETGVFFGSTILGKELIDDAENAGAAALETLQLYNKLGVFGNQKDSFEMLSNIFHETFEEVEIWPIGYCAVWKATKPRGARSE